MDDFDPKLDLVLKRKVPVTPDKVFQAWTQPEHLTRWFAPRPWSVASAACDPRPGGIFHVAMRSPEGEVMDGGAGCVLEAIEAERFVFTDALGPGFRPGSEGFFTGIITFEKEGEGCIYTAVARHGSEEACQKHDAMGFITGWGTCLDQLVALMS